MALFFNILGAVVGAFGALGIFSFVIDKVYNALKDKTEYFRSILKERGFKPPEGQSAIIPVLIGYVEKWETTGHTGVIDQNIDSTVFFCDTIEHRSDLSTLGYIRCNGNARTSHGILRQFRT